MATVIIASTEEVQRFNRSGGGVRPFVSMSAELDVDAGTAFDNLRVNYGTVLIVDDDVYVGVGNSPVNDATLSAVADVADGRPSA